jgi:hypothetical protein
MPKYDQNMSHNTKIKINKAALQTKFFIVFNY